MDTAQAIMSLPENNEAAALVETTGCGDEVSGGALTVDAFANKNSKVLFWVSSVMTGVIVLLLLLWIFGRIHFGKSTTSTYTSSFVPKAIVGATKQSNFGNYPNWYMQDGCAGYNCSVDTNSGRSLGFGMSNFEQQRKSNFGPLPGVRQQSNMSATGEAQRRAAEELLRKSNMEVKRQEHMTSEEARAQEERARAYIAARSLDEVGGRQAQVLAGCNSAWDPMATEEAKVLGAVGVFRPNTPGMSSFSRAINDTSPLSDAQLEAIMQGGEPYTISPAGIQDMDSLSAQQRREQVMTPPRGFV